MVSSVTGVAQDVVPGLALLTADSAVAATAASTTTAMLMNTTSDSSYGPSSQLQHPLQQFSTPSSPLSSSPAGLVAGYGAGRNRSDQPNYGEDSKLREIHLKIENEENCKQAGSSRKSQPETPTKTLPSKFDPASLPRAGFALPLKPPKCNFQSNSPIKHSPNKPQKFERFEGYKDAAARAGHIIWAPQRLQSRKTKSAQKMDTYPSYREAPMSRSPVERRDWESRTGSRDDNRPVERSERPDRGDSFYRGRSPGADRNRRPRNRSRSPANIERYEPSGRLPRDDYNGPRDRDRDRRRPSPGPPNIDRYIPGEDNGNGRGPGIGRITASTVNPLQNPAALPFQVGFSYFGEWWRTNEAINAEKEFERTGRRKDPRPRNPSQEEKDKEKLMIQTAYDAYKEDLQAKMAKTFVSEHKGEEWFQERYVEKVREPLRQKINENRTTYYKQWEDDLEAGMFDEFSLEGIPKSDSNGAGGVIEKEEGEMSAANEVLGVGDLLPGKGSDLRDENAFQPTLLIKTIAPHVNRVMLEAFCKEHLGEDEGGFKMLGLSDPNPSKRYHRIGWVVLHPASDIILQTERGDGKDEEMKDEGEDDNKDNAKVTSKSTAEKALQALDGKTVKDETRGDFTCHVGVHVPPQAPRKKALWDLFSAPERIERDLELAQRLISKYEEDFGSDFNAILKIEERVDDLKNQGRLAPEITGPVKKTKNTSSREKNDDLDVETEVDMEEEGEEGEDDEEDEGAYSDEVDDEDLIVKKKQLDLMVEYLRRVFNCCFFCVFESDSVHELIRKCPGGHLRRPRNTLSTAGKAAARASALGEPFPGKKKVDAEDGEIGSPVDERKEKSGGRNSQASKSEQQLQRAFNWVKTYEEKILQILEPENIDLRKIGGVNVDEALESEIKKFVRQEDDHKFRCLVPECKKLFKEEHFWVKHIDKRHPEFKDNMRTEFNLINVYVSDPAHIAPSRSDANSNGHFPTANGNQPAGTPRGFNLQNFGIAAMPPAPGLPPGQFPNFFAQAQQWAGDDRSGPQRRNGNNNRFGVNTRPGPYDRNGRPGGGQRWNNGEDRLSPQGGAGGRSRGASGVGRWGDGAGGIIAPREAVQGRSIRSYEDLDAVAGGGGGELNY